MMSGNHQPSNSQIEELTRLFGEGHHSAALELARRLTGEFANSAAAWDIRGASARALGDWDEAEESYRKLEALLPQYALAPHNLALVLQDRGEIDQAITAYRRALAVDPNLAPALNNLGIILTGGSGLNEAIALLTRACKVQPGQPEYLNSLGNALKRADRPSEAGAAYRAAIAAQPDYVTAIFNLGVLEQENGNAANAKAAYRAILTIEPGNALALSHLMALLAQDCDWVGLEEHGATIADLGVIGDAVPPMPMLAFEDAPDRQLARAKNWAERKFGALQPAPLSASPTRPPEPRPKRLRIAYFSGDFHDHPSMHLMAGLLAGHDRDRFEVHAFSYGAPRDDRYRRKARERVDCFHDVAQWSDAKIVDLARSTGIDIAIDRKGYSTGTRSHLFGYRLAPVQIGYLAYPGTMGTDAIDYIVGDGTVIPDRNRQYFAEKVIALPHSYQATDDQRLIADRVSSRTDHGLPESGFVFCCFNAAYKITPREFDIWMRVLGQIEGSVLWLFASNETAKENLRSHAHRRGVDPSRLVFAGRLPNPEHLARHAHADLFVDTFCVNAHTTTNDALWTGLPVVTRQGEQFAARVAASLLNAIELPELVTRSDAEYEALILELAGDPAKLRAIKAKLAANRLTAPLFNTALYVRHWEAGLDAAYDRYAKGLPPADISVTSQAAIRP